LCEALSSTRRDKRNLANSLTGGRQEEAEEAEEAEETGRQERKRATGNPT
jgi:hypothetical protein